MKRGSARMIIALLAVAAILGLWVRAIPLMNLCQSGTYGSAYCQGLYAQFIIEVVIVIVVALAAWVWAGQLTRI